MRFIGYLDSKERAVTFGDYLQVKGIANRVEREEDGRWALWVHSDDHLERAGSLLESYLEFQSDPEFERIARQAGDRRREERRRVEQAQANYIEVGRQWQQDRLLSTRVGRLTLALIVISVGVGVLSRLGGNSEALQPLLITRYEITELQGRSYIVWEKWLPEVRQGQVWRLVTPMFIHFGVLHLLFNMLWLKDLGSMIERRQGTWLLAVFVLATSVASNLAQFAWSGPNFGGMSGVVYGLLGYAWLRGRFDPRSGLSLDRRIVMWMGIWFVLCLTPVMGNVANAAHAAGLAVGCAWGFLSSGKLRRMIGG